MEINSLCANYLSSYADHRQHTALFWAQAIASIQFRPVHHPYHPHGTWWITCFLQGGIGREHLTSVKANGKNSIVFRAGTAIFILKN